MKKRKKRTSKKKKKKSNVLNSIAIFLAFIVVVLASILGYILHKQQEQEKKYKEEIVKKEKALKILREKIETLKKENDIDFSEIEDYKIAFKHVKKPKKSIKKVKKTKPHKKEEKITKPKLVIIIDDVSFKYQTDLIKSIPLRITPSFFPPSFRHPDTPRLAKSFSHYMIHMPMEAMRYKREEVNTLHIKDSYLTILNRIQKVKKLFPNAKYLNNHTGSKFTSNQEAMKKLFRALKKENLNFVDSKTTPISQADYANSIYKIKLYSRDIFLDNKLNPAYIRNQLQKAVNIAKRRGYAIAIGHPHKVTLLTIKHSGDILKNVKVVYIDELK